MTEQPHTPEDNFAWPSARLDESTRAADRAQRALDALGLGADSSPQVMERARQLQRVIDAAADSADRRILSDIAQRAGRTLADASFATYATDWPPGDDDRRQVIHGKHRSTLPITDEHRAKVAAERAHVRDRVMAWTRCWLTGQWTYGPVLTLILASPYVGTGKSHLAAAALRELALGMPSRTGTYRASWAWWQISDYLGIQRARMSDAEYEQPARRAEADCRACDVLVIDDLGTHRGTQWELEQIYTIVHSRWSAGLVTIITTNGLDHRSIVAGLKSAEPGASVGDAIQIDRIASRLAQSGRIVRFSPDGDWPDMRTGRVPVKTIGGQQ